MRIWVVAAMVTAATIIAVAAAYGVGTLVGLQIATSNGAPIRSETPGTSGPRDEHPRDEHPRDEHPRDDVELNFADAVLGPYDPEGSIAAYCERGELALGGGRLGAGGGVRMVDDAPIAGSGGFTRPIGWRVEVERTDPDHSPRFFTAYVVCRAG
ncbi:hypothetical protein [Agromyces italicus]|uniref:hypothetical protein n=1 Tax=Agromyces italicus TaxID=279572 RepID=UPI0003B6318B|nr:hypothetical protein [Agromyces italicus]